MRTRKIVLTTLICLAGSPAVHADILALQPVTNFRGLASQVFTDPPVGAVISFDDITVTGNGWDITKVTAFGFEGIAGRIPTDTAVSLAFMTTPDVTTIGTTYAGKEVNINNAFDLVFDQSIHLDPGTYYLTAYVTRPIHTEGQWFFHESTPVNGSDFFLQNPDGGLGVGTGAFHPNPGHDLAFEIDGTWTPTFVVAATPEPGSVTLLVGVGVTGIGLLTRRRKQANRR